MKRKLLTILLSIAIVFSFMPKNTMAEGEPEWWTVENIQTVVPDPTFAKVIYDSVCDQGVDWSACSNVIDVLKNFEGDITYKKTNSTFIKSIEGAQYLEKAEISISNQSFTDVTPIGRIPDYTNPRNIAIGFSPVRNWPSEFADKSGEKYAFSNPQAFFGTATYLFDETAPKKQTINYDVLVEGSPAVLYVGETDTVQTDNSYYAKGEGKSIPDKDAPAASDTSASFTLPTGASVVSSAHIALPVWPYMSGPTNGDKIAVSYDYTINSKFYYLLKLDVDTETVGGFKIVKYDEEDAEKTPLAGATFEVTDSEGNEIEGSPFTTTDNTPIITVNNLPAGTYTVKEIAAPKGYSVNNKEFTVEVKSAVPTVGVNGGIPSVAVNNDTETWNPNWESGFVANGGSYSNMKLVASKGTTEVTPADKGALAILANAADDSTGTPIEFTEVDILGYSNDELTFTVTQKTSLGEKVLLEDGTLSAAEEIINGLTTKNEHYGTIYVSVNGLFTQNESKYETLEVTDKKFTIWIENTTGDEGKYSKDAGGWVNIVGEPENNIASSFNEQNLERRKTIACTQGRADTENGWSIDLDRIAVGPMGPDGKSGATYFIKGIKDGITEFEFDLGATEGVIKGHVEYDEKAQTIKICIDVDDPDLVLDRDIDVAVAFKKVQVAPNTGDSYNLYIYVTAAVTSLAACAYIFKRVIKA